MPNLPTVCAVLLANGRAAMVERAIRSFCAQTYPAYLRELFVFDNGPALDIPSDGRVHRCDFWMHAGKSIGELRNLANGLVEHDAIVHWDSDDWSAPERISEQVALLKSTGAHAVGYSDLLFWRASDQSAFIHTDAVKNECSKGTSLCYWREAWRKVPFPDLNVGEDVVWWRAMRAVGMTTAIASGVSPEPRMIAENHPGNTTKTQILVVPEWSRAPGWDKFCAERMTL